MFQNQTVEGLGKILADVAMSPSTDGDALVSIESTPPFAMSGLEGEELDRFLAQHPDVEDIYPVTALQEGMLFHTVFTRGTGIYVMQFRFVIEGLLVGMRT